MGSPMAANLVKAGFEPAVYDCVRAKCEPLEALGDPLRVRCDCCGRLRRPWELVRRVVRAQTQNEAVGAGPHILRSVGAHCSSQTAVARATTAGSRSSTMAYHDRFLVPTISGNCVQRMPASRER